MDDRPALVEVASAPARSGRFLDAGGCLVVPAASPGRVADKKKPAEAGKTLEGRRRAP
jgi:hypothetical protein